MRKLLLGLVVLILIVAVAALSGFFWWQTAVSPVNPARSQTVSFSVSVGETGAQVLNRLLQANLVKSQFAAQIYFRISGVGSQFKPGTYQLSQSLSLPQISNLLISGPKDIKVTFPEGLRREEYAARIKQINPAFDQSEFLRLTANLEGRLFPDTYLLPPTITPAQAVAALTANFTAKVGEVDSTSLILASLVEREAKTDADRQIVAQILYKRLQEDWPLQVDASIQYGEATLRCARSPLDCQWWQPVVSTSTTTVYNTYAHPGLPPTAICNPGAAAINAAVAAKSTPSTPYWYYLTDSSGVTHYSRTLTEHNLNVDKYLRP